MLVSDIVIKASEFSSGLCFSVTGFGAKYGLGFFIGQGLGVWVFRV